MFSFSFNKYLSVFQYGFLLKKEIVDMLLEVFDASNLLFSEEILQVVGLCFDFPILLRARWQRIEPESCIDKCLQLLRLFDRRLLGRLHLHGAGGACQNAQREQNLSPARKFVRGRHDFTNTFREFYGRRWITAVYNCWKFILKFYFWENAIAGGECNFASSFSLPKRVWNVHDSIEWIFNFR